MEYTYEVVDFLPYERLVMRTAEGPFLMETTYTWEALGEGQTRNGPTIAPFADPAGNTIGLRKG